MRNSAGKWAICMHNLHLSNRVQLYAVIVFFFGPKSPFSADRDWCWCLLRQHRTCFLWRKNLTKLSRVQSPTHFTCFPIPFQPCISVCGFHSQACATVARAGKHAQPYTYTHRTAPDRLYPQDCP